MVLHHASSKGADLSVMRGPRKFCQRGSNSDNVFFFVTEERIQKALKTDHHRPASEKPLLRERSGSVVECVTQDRRAAGSSLTGVTVFLSNNINPSLVLVQPRKTRPYITERLLMERKESNQTNTHLNSSFYVFHIDFRR